MQWTMDIHSERWVSTTFRTTLLELLQLDIHSKRLVSTTDKSNKDKIFKGEAVDNYN